MHSLRSRLWLLWCLVAAASVGVGLLLMQLYRTSLAAQLGRGEAVVARACDMVRDRYGFYVAGWDGAGVAPDGAAFGRDLLPVIAAGLREQPGIEGGIWSPSGPLASIVQGAELPAAGLPAVRAANQDAARGEQSVVRRIRSGTGALLLAACPLGGPFNGLTAWAATRVQGEQGYDGLRTGLGLLLALVGGIAGWVTWLTARLGRHVGTIEAALAAHDLEALPILPRTGERELDRIVAALDDAGQRLAAARARAATLAAQVAAAERLAALGRVAAGVAHEIRNPMAAMRLRAENALAGDPARQRPALEASLVQIARVDRLMAELLAMTQRRPPEPQALDLRGLLAQRLAEYRAQADQAGVCLLLDGDATPAWLDPELIGRAVDNLLLNAIRHTPAGGTVRVRADAAEGAVRITVADTGPGVDPALRPRLFEPFSTGRPDGTGLGLAIAREMAEAHGGTLRLAEASGAGQGACFVLVLPQETPSPGPPCPPS